MPSFTHTDWVAAFDTLWQRVATLTTVIQDENLPCWVVTGDRQMSDDRGLVAQVYGQLDYQQEQEGRETWVLPGLVGCSSEVIELATEVNEAKLAFKQEILKAKAHFKQRDTLVLHHFLKQSKTRCSPALREKLSGLGLGRLHLKQCYRRIPILAQSPKKVSWTWTHTRAVKKISLEQAEQRLVKKSQDVGIQIQLAKLRTLKPGTPLAIVQALSPHCCANIVQHNGERNMLKSPVPILYPSVPTQAHPMVVAPTLDKSAKAERKGRSDRKIADEAFLPAIRAHCYQ